MTGSQVSWYIVQQRENTKANLEKTKKAKDWIETIILSYFATKADAVLDDTCFKESRQ